MIDPNDKSLDEYLSRESVVSQRYRELDADDVPPQLDAAVLAQARAASAARSKSKSTWMKWSAPLALAASAVLIVAIVLEVEVQDDVRMPAAQMEQTATSPASLETLAVEEKIQEAPVPAAAPPPAKLETPSPADKAVREREATALPEVAQSAFAPRESAPQGGTAQSTERAAIESVVVAQPKPQYAAVQDAPVSAVTTSADELVPIPSEPTAAPADAASTGSVVTADQARADLSEEIMITANRRQQQRSAPVPPKTAITARPPPPAPSAAKQPPPRLAAEEWLDQIRALRSEGKVLEADEQWQAFRKAYPNFKVAETDAARPKP